MNRRKALLTLAISVLFGPMSGRAQTVLSEQRLQGFRAGDRLGAIIAPVGDFDDSGRFDFLIGVPGCDNSVNNVGCLPVLDITSSFEADVVDIERTGAWHRPGSYPSRSDLELGGISQIVPIGDVDMDGYVDVILDGRNGVISRELKGDSDLNCRGDLVLYLGTDRNWFSGAGGLADLDGNGTREIAIRTDASVGVRFTSAWEPCTDSEVWESAFRIDYSVDFAVPGGVGPGSAITVPGLGPGGDRVILLTGTEGIAVVGLAGDGTPASVVVTSNAAAGWPAEYRAQPEFGKIVAELGDLDGDGLPEFGLGLPDWNEGVLLIGTVEAGGTVRYRAAVRGRDAWPGLSAGDGFASSFAAAGDIDGDGLADLLAGVPGRDEDAGGLVVFSLSGALDATGRRLLDARQPDWMGVSGLTPTMGQPLGDIDGDGHIDFVAGEHRSGRVEYDSPVEIVFGADGGLLDRFVPIRAAVQVPTGEYTIVGFAGIAPAGDLDGNGVVDLLVNTIHAGRTHRLTVLYRAADGSVVREWTSPLLRLSAPVTVTVGGSVSAVADLDGDGVMDIIMAVSENSAPFTTQVVAWLMNADGSVRNTTQSEASGIWLTPDSGCAWQQCTWDDRGVFGSAGDINRDGVPDLVGIDVSGPANALGFLVMNADGRVREAIRVDSRDPAVDLPAAGRLVLHEVIPDEDGDGRSELLLLHSEGVSNSPRTLLKVMLGEGGIPKHTIPLMTEADGWPMAGPEPMWVVTLGDRTGDGVPEYGFVLDPERWQAPHEKVSLVTVDLGGRVPSVMAEPVIEPAEPIVGRSITVRSGVSLPAATDRVTLYVRQGGETSSFIAIDMTSSAGNFRVATVPPIFSSERGLEYYLESRTVRGVTYRLPASGYRSLPIESQKGLSQPLEAGSQEDGYRIAGLPLVAEDDTAISVLERSFGPFDASRWRAYLGADGSGEVTGDDRRPLRPGTGFWVLTGESGRFLSTGPGMAVRTDMAWSMTMPRGWTLMANPYPFPITGERLRSAEGLPVDVRRFDGAWSTLGASDTLDVFEGVAVYNSSTSVRTLQFWPPGLEMPASKKGSSITEAGEWRVTARARRGSARDVDTELGVSQGALDGFDLMDRPEAPRVGSWVGLALRHPDPAAPEPLYTSDVRKAGTTTGDVTWMLDVSSARPGRVTVSFDGMDTLPDGMTLVLEDPVTGARQDLAVSPTYAMAVDGASSRLLTVTARLGEDAETDVPPDQVALHAAFPNPFAGATTIPIDLPQASPVRLEVFDLLGRRVASLVDGPLHAGRHVIIWDAASQPSGTYFVRMTAGEIVERRSVRVVN